MKKMTNSELLAQSRTTLRGNWGIAIAICLVYLLIVGSAGCIPIVGLIIGGPFMVGLSRAFLSLSKGEEFKFDDLFSGFSDFGRSFVACLLMSIYVVLWSLLFIIPGIVKGLSYSLTFFILVEEPNLTADQAITKSEKMMDGYKSQLFRLCIRFVLLSILCVLTLGIGFIWFYPYVMATLTEFYQSVKQAYVAQYVD